MDDWLTWNKKCPQHTSETKSAIKDEEFFLGNLLNFQKHNLISLFCHSNQSLGSPGKKKPPKNVPPSLKTISESTPPKPDVNQHSQLSLGLTHPDLKALSLGIFFLNAVTDVLPTYPPLVLTPGKRAGDVSKDFSKPQMILQRQETKPL